jgi:hypothetical protein
LAAYSTDFSDQVGDKRTAIAVPLVTSAGTLLTDPTNFEQDDATVGAAVVSMNHLVAPFELTNEDLQNGQALMTKAESKLQLLAEGIKAKINAIVTSAFTNTAETVAISAFAETNARNLWASLNNGKKSLILNPTAFSKIAPNSLTSFQIGADGKIGGGFLGYDGVYVDAYLTGIGYSNVYGWSANPAAIAVATRIPSVAQIEGMNSTIASQVVQIPTLGISVLLKMWVKPGSNSVWASYEVLAGAARGQVTALTVVKSA